MGQETSCRSASRTDTTPSRRRLLQSVGTVAGMATLGGCTRVIGQSTSSDNAIEYWTLFGGGDGETMAKMTDQAAKNHDITVNRQRSTNNYYTRLYTSLIGNEAPDVAVVHATRLEAYKDLVEPVGDVLGTSPYLDSIAEHVVRDGRQLAAPLDAHPYGLYYNKEIFEEAGLDPNDPPNTPKKFQNAARTIAEETDHWSIQYHGGETVVNTVVMLINSLGGQLLTDNGRPTLNNDKGLATARLLYNWVRENKWCPADSETGWDAWNRGDLGMIFEGTWHINVVRDADFEFGITQPFVMPDSTNPKTWSDSHTLIIPKSDSRSVSKRTDTIALIKALTQELNTTWGSEAGHVPASKQAGKSNQLKSSKTWKQTLRVFYGMAENGQLAYEPATNNNQEYINQVSQYFQQMRLGSLSPKQTIQQTAEGIREVYV